MTRIQGPGYNDKSVPLEKEVDKLKQNTHIQKTSDTTAKNTTVDKEKPIKAFFKSGVKVLKDLGNVPHLIAARIFGKTAKEPVGYIGVPKTEIKIEAPVASNTKVEKEIPVESTKEVLLSSIKTFMDDIIDTQKKIDELEKQIKTLDNETGKTNIEELKNKLNQYKEDIEVNQISIDALNEELTEKFPNG